MRQTLILLTYIALYVMIGIGCTRKTVPGVVVPIHTDKETKIVHIETIDTVYVDVPAQSAERTTTEKVSHLETEYAESDARINDDGTLTHILNNKPGMKPVPVKTSNDTVYMVRECEKPVPVEVPVEVERKLTAWEKVRLRSFWPLIACVAAIIAWQFLKRRMILK